MSCWCMQSNVFWQLLDHFPLANALVLDWKVHEGVVLDKVGGMSLLFFPALLLLD